MPTVKPTPPRRDPGDDSTRFTAEDKVFFIHYLRWALLRKPTMDKSDLYEALAKEVRRRFPAVDSPAGRVVYGTC